MTNEELFKELQRRVRLLNELMKDPQPGMYSWAMFYGEHMEWISNYCRPSTRSVISADEFKQ